MEREQAIRARVPDVTDAPDAAGLEWSRLHDRLARDLATTVGSPGLSSEPPMEIDRLLVVLEEWSHEDPVGAERAWPCLAMAMNGLDDTDAPEEWMVSFRAQEAT